MVGCCGSVQCITWDGGYGRGEIELTFVDSEGRPVPGVRLRVEDGEGHEFFLYPVSDYLPDHIPTSDADGRMVLHHAFGEGFSGHTCQVLFHYVVVKRGPKYICRFLRDDKEVARAPFGELDQWGQRWADVPKVKRRWKWPAWPLSELYKGQETDYGDFQTRVWKYYDFDGTGRLSPDAVPAFGTASDVAQELVNARVAGNEPAEWEIEFALVRRTIVVPDSPK
jgi:hypothetical protein